MNKKNSWFDRKTEGPGARWFTALLVIPLIGASCAGGGGAKKAGELRFITLEETRVVSLFPGDGGEGPRMIIRLRLPDFGGGDGSPGAPVQRALYGGTGAEEYAEELIASKTEDYRRESESPDRGEALNWEYTELIDPVEGGGGLLVFARSREYFLGGAHGMREKRFFVIDPARGKAVRLEEFIRPEALPALGELLGAALRREAGLDAGSSLREGGFFEDAVEPPDNFFPGTAGLAFHWDPYEIAPYAAGPAEAVLPWEAVREFLTPPYRELFQASAD
jgi:hypothetical protein